VAHTVSGSCSIRGVSGMVYTVLLEMHSKRSQRITWEECWQDSAQNYALPGWYDTSNQRSFMIYDPFRISTDCLYGTSLDFGLSCMVLEVSDRPELSTG